MALGNILKKRRDTLGLSRYDIERGMEQRGFRLAPSTLRNWETGRKNNSTEWDPAFLRALADTLDMTEIDLLAQLGFKVVPDGYTIEDIELARRIRGIPAAERGKMYKAMLGLLDNLGIK